jgi:putative membrane protein
MKKIDSNNVMILLLFISGIYFFLGLILDIPISEIAFMIGLILLSLIIIIIHGWKTLGPRELFVFFLIAYGITLIYEFTDGLGFGEWMSCRAVYSDLLGPKLLGKTPYVIPLVWSISLYLAFTMTNIIFNRLQTTNKFEENISYRWFLKIIGMGIVAGLIMVSWDLINDPVMVAIGAWSWSSGGSYYGIPLGNFEAWVEISVVVFVVYSLYLYKVKKSQMYIGGEQKSSYTLLVVVLYLALLLIYSIYAIYEEIMYAIPWAAITMCPLAVITIFKFYRHSQK